MRRESRFAVRLNMTWPAVIVLWVLALVGAWVLVVVAITEMS